jgi:predicted secreted Zn-dependent protease
MRTCLILLTVAFVAVACGPPQAPPAFGPPLRAELLQSEYSNTEVVDGVRIDEGVWLETYDVSAAGGLVAVRRQLDRLGPVSDETGQRFDGLTRWALNLRFNYDEGRDGCKLRSATIYVEAVITLPELADPGLLSPQERALWDGYLVALREHEDGHVDHYLSAARELRDEIFNTGTLADCRDLANALGRSRDQTIETIRQRDRLYDAATGHGAVFPR